MRKKILLLGSTGSIGRNTLEVIDQNPEEFELVGISAHSNVDLLRRQCQKYNPGFVCISRAELANDLAKTVYNGNHVYYGSEGLRTMIREAEADLVVNSIVGAAGLLPTLDAIAAGKNVALANKESLVVAGELVMAEARKHGVEIFPVDSEHSAIWQCLIGEDNNSIRRIILTASGGPFLKRKGKTFDSITVEEALNHPKWKMGNKITIDSATLMNKGFEVIETFWLFGVPPDNIDVVIHPQSIIHSMVEFIDGSIKAQLGIPDMKLPIQFALTYPERRPMMTDNSFLFSQVELTFEPPDYEQFPCLLMAYRSLEAGGTAPAVLNAANEVAVDLFMKGAIKFSEIPVLIDTALQLHTIKHKPSLEDHLEADRWARNVTQQKVQHYD